MYRDLVEAPERISYQGMDFWVQRFNHLSGAIAAIWLYTADGEPLGSYETTTEIMEALEAASRLAI